MSAVEIGAWARHAAGSIDCRLLVCCVVPCRSVFTALVGLGAVASGGSLFQKGIHVGGSFESQSRDRDILGDKGGEPKVCRDYRNAPKKSAGRRWCPLYLRRARPRKWGRWFFSEAKFRECIFSEEKLPSGSASDQFERAERFYRTLGVPAGPSWLMTAGAEVRFVANRAAFMTKP
jgi:hypothetical protein